MVGVKPTLRCWVDDGGTLHEARAEYAVEDG